jgi:hypothetical protein
MIQSLALALVGALVVLLTRWFMPGQTRWLDSGQGVIVITLLLALLAVPVGASFRPVQPRSWRRPGALWFGANIAMVGVMVAAGGAGRNLFPFAVVLEGVFSAIAITAGSLVGYFMRATWSRVSSKSRHTAR